MDRREEDIRREKNMMYWKTGKNKNSEISEDRDEKTEIRT